MIFGQRAKEPGANKIIAPTSKNGSGRRGRPKNFWEQHAKKRRIREILQEDKNQMEEHQETLELFGGKSAAEVAGYDSYPGFWHSAKRYPIPDQGYRYNGKPVWTKSHLIEWRKSVPSSGWPGEQPA